MLTVRAEVPPPVATTAHGVAGTQIAVIFLKQSEGKKGKHFSLNLQSNCNLVVEPFNDTTIVQVRNKTFSE